jgi:hypothetical protein
MGPRPLPGQGVNSAPAPGRRGGRAGARRVFVEAEGEGKWMDRMRWPLGLSER